MDLKLLALPFPENQIEWRIARCGKKGNGQVWAKCLAYVSARATMDRLDEVCGPENWMVEYRFIPASQGTTPGVIAKLMIRCSGTDASLGQWIAKEDGADQTDIEAFKGGISSALKRAGVVWNLGRYLYGLEEGFAQIVDRGVAQARYAKDKEAGEFYWIPPKLPQWALPKGETSQALPQVHPEAPNVGDGILSGEYEIPYGPLAKKPISQCDPVQLKAYVEEIQNKAITTGRTIPIWARRLIVEAQPYINLEPGSNG